MSKSVTLRVFQMPFAASGGAVPLSSQRSDASEVPPLALETLAHDRMAISVILDSKTLEIIERVVVAVLILVVDLMAFRDRTSRILPHVTVKKSAAALGGVEIAPQVLMFAPRIAAVPMPSVDDNLRFGCPTPHHLILGLL
jgi:hypothetical protein